MGDLMYVLVRQTQFQFAILVTTMMVSLSGCRSAWYGTVQTLALLDSTGRAASSSTHTAVSTPTTAPTTVPTAATDLLTFLNLVPNEPTYRQMLTYGDAAAWYRSWEISPLNNLAALDRLDEREHDLWLFTLSKQTVPPAALGLQYMFQDDPRDHYGFSFFDAVRYMEAGSPPGTITVVEIEGNVDLLNERLLTFGYSATQYTELPAGWTGTLYSINDDFAMNLSSPSAHGRLGELNRIGVIHRTDRDVNYLIIGRATEVVTRATRALRPTAAALADDRHYQAAVQALMAPDLADTGELIGVIFLGEPNFSDPAQQILGSQASAEQIRALHDQIAAQPALPPIRVAAFATRHMADTTYLIVALVFPTGVSLPEIEETLSTRLTNYQSIVTRASLNARWSLDRVFSNEFDGVPVAVAAMQLAAYGDGEEFGTTTPPLAWIDLIVRRDLLFLATE